MESVFLHSKTYYQLTDLNQAPHFGPSPVFICTMQASPHPIEQEYYTHAPVSSYDQCRADDQVRALDVDIRRLVDQRCAVRRTRNSLSPIDRLPDECLSTIFLLAYEADLNEVLEDDPDDDTGPGCHRDCSKSQVTSAVSQVCQRWRSIALGTSRLWAKMSLHIHNTTKSAEQAALDAGLLSQRLDRGAVVPQLDLEIDFELRELNLFDCHEDITTSVTRNLDILAPYIGKCRRLCLHVPPVSPEHELVCDRLLDSMTALERLLLWGNPNYPMLSVPMPPISPRLAYLTLSNVTVPNLCMEALGQLNELNIFSSSLRICPREPQVSGDDIEANRDTWRDYLYTQSREPGLPLDLLQSCAHLRRLKVGDANILSSEKPKELVLPALVDLELCFLPFLILWNPEQESHSPSHSLPMAHFIRYVNMPTLRICKLNYAGAHDGADDVVRELANARPPLLELSLTGFVSRNGGPYVELLRALPSLEAFSVSHCSLPADVFEALQVKSEDTLVPKIRSFHIDDLRRYPDVAEVDSYETRLVKAVRTLLQSRFESTEVATLDDFELSCPDPDWAKDHLSGVEAWVRNLSIKSSLTRYGKRPPTGPSRHQWESESDGTEIEVEGLWIPLTQGTNLEELLPSRVDADTEGDSGVRLEQDDSNHSIKAKTEMV